MFDVDTNDNNDFKKVPVMRLFRSMKKDSPVDLDTDITFREVMKFLHKETNLSAIKKDL